ncbi:MAG: radical SAM protein, partial [Bacilli bacterium]|nr:radical SAM protein [Bacilli bacterium]
MAKTVKEVVTSIGMKRVISYIDKDPDTNIPKILDWLENHDLGGGVIKQVKSIKETIKDKDNNWYRLIKSLWTDVDDGVRRKLFENFVVNASMIGTPKQNKMKAKYSCNVPWAILLDPTSACNLHCIGCWAAEYGNKLNLTYEELNDIVVQGKKLGTYFYIFSGGEPLVRKDDIIKLCKQHNDCAFLSFTNGTLIDEKFADEMLKVKNFIPAISIEGFEEDTDFRRGKGTFNKVVRATEILKAKKLPFGFSCCYTSKNVETIGSEDYFNFMVNIGAKFAWFFTYIPVGKDAVVDLMVTPEQRKKMYHVIRDFRKTKPLFTLDFWND